MSDEYGSEINKMTLNDGQGGGYGQDGGDGGYRGGGDGGYGGGAPDAYGTAKPSDVYGGDAPVSTDDTPAYGGGDGGYGDGEEKPKKHQSKHGEGAEGGEFGGSTGVDSGYGGDAAPDSGYGGKTVTDSGYGGNTDGGNTDGGYGDADASAAVPTTGGYSAQGTDTYASEEPPAPVSQLTMGESLPKGGSIVSSDGSGKAVLQGDGNFVVYKGNSVVWASNTGNGAHKPDTLVLQGDHNLVLNAGSTFAGWATNTGGKGKGGCTLTVNEYAELCLVDDDGTTLWTSKAAHGHHR